MDPLHLVLVAAATTVIAALVALASRGMRRWPTAAVGGGVRLPIVIGVLGWLIVVAGAAIGIVAFSGDGDADDPLAMRIASVAMVVGGLGIVVLHRNWRLAVLDDRVYQRTALGRVRCVAYDDIVASSLRSMRGSPILEVRASDGTRIAVNPASFDVRPLMQAIAGRGYRGHQGERW